ncbi:MAG: ATPase, T2SS/T4P/T4SS family [Chloroflexota bacterium]
MPAKKKQTALTLITPLLEDPDVTEIMIDGTERITIEKRNGIEDTGLHFQSDAEVKAAIQEVLKLAGVELEEGKTIYDVRLGDNSRMIAILAPTSINGHSVTFRKWMKKQITWEKFLEYNAISTAARDLVQGALNAHVSILIAGGTASGKTTFANRVVELIPPDARVVVVEQAHELQFDHPRSIFLEADGAVATPINDLLTAGSKMRPDWLVIGELHGSEALHALQIMGNGHSAISAMHATSAENALTRLEAMCLMANLGLGMDEIRQTIVSAIRLIAYQERLPSGNRKVVQLVELKGLEDSRYILQPLMRYDAEKDSFEMTGVKPSWEK